MDCLSFYAALLVKFWKQGKQDKNSFEKSFPLLFDQQGG